MVVVVMRAAAVNCCTVFKLGGEGKNNLLRAGRGDGVKSMTSMSTSTTSWRLARASFACFFVDVTTTFLVFVGDFAGALAAVVFAEAFLATAAFLATGFFWATPPFPWASFFSRVHSRLLWDSWFGQILFSTGLLVASSFFWPAGHFFGRTCFPGDRLLWGEGG
jgi:hypothetical protein